MFHTGEGEYKLREELASLKTIVHAVIARSIDAKSNMKKKRNKYRKSGRRNGHKGKSRRKPEHID